METDAGWWHRLGGPNAINVPAWVFTLVGGTAAAFAWIPRGTLVRTTDWIGLSIVAQVILGAVLLLAWFTYLSPRNRRPRPFALIVTLLVAGAIRGAFLSIAGERFGLVQQGYLLERSLGAAISFTAWYAISALIVDDWRRHQQAVAQLTVEARRELELAERAARIVKEFRVTLVERTEGIVRAQLFAAAEASAQPAGASQSLQRSVDEVIRPLSHEMERRSIEDEALVQEADKYRTRPKVPFRSYLIGTFTERPFAPLLTSIIVIVTPPLVTMHVLGPVVGVIVLLTAGLGLGLALSLLRSSIAAALPSWSLPRCVAVVTGCWLGLTVLIGLILSTIVRVSGVMPNSWLANGGSTGATSTVVAILSLGLLTMIVSAIEGSIQAQHRRAERDLKTAALSAEWAAARLRQSAGNEQRRFGRIVHGGVQARMVAAAALVQQQTPQEAATTIANLADGIHDALATDGESPWRQEFSDMEDVWSVAINLTFNIAPTAESALDSDVLAARSVVTVIGEAITNAVRHGDADTVRATITAEPGYLEITVMNDGKAVLKSTERGMGSRLYDSNFATWNITASPTTTLRGRIPCDVHRPHVGALG
ncbi:MAG: hypothetical protein NTZ03_15180 [Actinobacteria bacterium]|nr:hypothetical protein [Actinomycetota bacterium]